MKLTVVVDDKGTFVAAQERSTVSEKEAGLVAGPGQKLHEIDVPEDLRAVQDPKQFLTKVSPLVPGMRAH
ncbi:hypothetical protein [uncultured Ralstonia sp.]|jgi:hypothetical protein|uniref:hypothetical protein n=1 Tax=uncultured Ralstonia sp. TaxID=114715 RepID=UPI0025DB9170|nr:hypothetical protein [uncultured Ralstonia sp.]